MGLFSFLGSLFKNRKIDESFYEELEDSLLEGDLGSSLTAEVSDTLREKVKEEKITNGEDLKPLMKEILSKYIYTLSPSLEEGLNVILLIGVNGVGKTTTLAKMALYYKNRGRKVLLGASDTFRAAAVDQLSTHAERIGVRVVKNENTKDPASVVFDSIDSARRGGEDLVLLDSAGRMHNKENLLKELQKMDKIIKGKGIDPHHYKVLLTLDAVTGQNAISQAETFNSFIKVDGIILTKYDSLSKGGFIVRIGKELNLPIIFIADGEKYENLHPFDKKAFLSSLIGE